MKLVTDRRENSRRAALRKACAEAAMWQNAYNEAKADIEICNKKIAEYDCRLNNTVAQLDDAIGRLRTAQATLKGIEKEWLKERSLRQSLETKWAQQQEAWERIKNETVR